MPNDGMSSVGTDPDPTAGLRFDAACVLLGVLLGFLQGGMQGSYSMQWWRY